MVATHLPRMEICHRSRHIRREGQSQSPGKGVGREDKLPYLPSRDELGDDAVTRQCEIPWVIRSAAMVADDSVQTEMLTRLARPRLALWIGRGRGRCWDVDILA